MINALCQCADGGSDLNILSPEILSKLPDKQPELKVTTFDTARKYGLTAKTDDQDKDIYIASDKQVMTGLELFM